MILQWSPAEQALLDSLKTGEQLPTWLLQQIKDELVAKWAVGAGGQGYAYRYQLPQQLDQLSDRFKQRLEQLCKQSRAAVQQEVLKYIVNIVAKEYKTHPARSPCLRGPSRLRAPSNPMSSTKWPEQPKRSFRKHTTAYGAGLWTIQCWAHAVSAKLVLAHRPSSACNDSLVHSSSQHSCGRVLR
jgi:hypothetical protein